jgi:hypothetical protein
MMQSSEGGEWGNVPPTDEQQQQQQTQKLQWGDERELPLRIVVNVQGQIKVH